MLYASCSSGLTVCNLTKFPMISDVIADSVYDRIFILMNTAYFVGVHQVNVRCLYARFHGILSVNLSRGLLISGLISSFSLPLIGLFDNRAFEPLHNLFAGTFFLSSGYYLSHTAYLMLHHKEKLLQEHQLLLSDSLSKKIEFNDRFSWLCTLSITCFLLSALAFGNKSSQAALFEWTCVFLYMTLTMLIMSVFPCFDQMQMTLQKGRQYTTT